MREVYFIKLLNEVEKEAEKEISSIQMLKLRDVLRFIDDKHKKRMEGTKIDG